MPYLAQSGRLLYVDVQFREKGALLLVNCNTPVPVATVGDKERLFDAGEEERGMLACIPQVNVAVLGALSAS